MDWKYSKERNGWRSRDADFRRDNRKEGKFLVADIDGSSNDYKFELSVNISPRRDVFTDAEYYYLDKILGARKDVDEIVGDTDYDSIDDIDEAINSAKHKINRLFERIDNSDWIRKNLAGLTQSR